MKYVLLLLLSFSMLQGFSQNTGIVKLSGVLMNFNNQVDINDHSEFKDLSLPGSDRIIIPDNTGKFSISFKLSAPQYFKLGRNVLYLSPGNVIELFVDYKDPRKATFKGSAVQENEYLRDTPFPKGGSFLDAGANIKNGIAATIKEIEAAGANRLNHIGDLKGVSTAFINLEKARVKADIINSLQSMEFYYPYRMKIKGDSVALFKKSFDAEVKPVIARYSAGFINASFMQLETYRGLAEDLIQTSNAAASKDYATIKSWIAAVTIVDSLKGMSDKSKIAGLGPKIAAIKIPAYKIATEKVYQQLIKFGNGDKAIDFTAYDVDGKAVNMKTFAGKTIYIDLWATWCGPCQDELKHLEVLKEKFKNNSDVVFVSLSIDDDQQLWKQSLKTRNVAGIQLIVNRSKLNDYAISGIPRTIIIDKNFQILQMNGLQPSNKGTEAYLMAQSSK